MNRPCRPSLEFLLILACGIALSTSACASLGRSSYLEARCVQRPGDTLILQETRHRFIGLVGFLPILPFFPYWELPDRQNISFRLAVGNHDCPEILDKTGKPYPCQESGRSFTSFPDFITCHYLDWEPKSGDTLVGVFGGKAAAIRIQRTGRWIYSPFFVQTD